MRVIAGIVVAVGPGIALVGEVAVFVRYDDLERQAASNGAIGASITAVGFLLHLLDGSVRRRRRAYTTPDVALRPSHGAAAGLWRRRNAS